MRRLANNAIYYNRIAVGERMGRKAIREVSVTIMKGLGSTLRRVSTRGEVKTERDEKCTSKSNAVSINASS